MRLAAASILVLAGCRQLFGFDSATSSDALGDDDASPIDSSGDARPPTVCSAFSFSSAGLLPVTGDSYSVGGSGLAVFADPSGAIKQFSVVASAQLVSFPNDTATFTHPRITPSTADEMFVVGTETTVTTLRRSQRIVGTNWGSPVVQSVVGLTLSSTLFPGVPTTTQPRRMVVEQDGQFDELVETATDQWTAIATVSPAGFASIRQPSFSIDGLTIVFAGKLGPGSVFAIYLVSRDSLAGEFGNPSVLTDNPDGGAGIEVTPTLSPDCKHLFVSFNDNDRILDLH